MQLSRYYSSPSVASRMKNFFNGPVLSRAAQVEILLSGQPMPVFAEDAGSPHFAEATGYTTAIDLRSGTLFKFNLRIDQAMGQLVVADEKLEGSFDPDEVAVLRLANGLPPSYKVAPGSVEHFLLSSQVASRLEDLCNELHIPLPAIEGYSPRAPAPLSSLKARPCEP